MWSLRGLSELWRCPGPAAPHGRHADVALAVVHCSAQDPHHLRLERMQQRVRHLHHVLQHRCCLTSRYQQPRLRHGRRKHLPVWLWALNATCM